MQEHIQPTQRARLINSKIKHGGRIMLKLVLPKYGMGYVTGNNMQLWMSHFSFLLDRFLPPSPPLLSRDPGQWISLLQVYLTLSVLHSSLASTWGSLKTRSYPHRHVGISPFTWTCIHLHVMVSPQANRNSHGGINARRYTLVHGFCFF